MSWSLDQAYGEFPRIEDEFSAALEQSMNPAARAAAGRERVVFVRGAAEEIPAAAATFDLV